jgi:hypothetical protein
VQRNKEVVMRTLLLLCSLVTFVVWSLWLVHDDGLEGLVVLLRTDWGKQVFVDLVIAASIAWAALHHDPRGRPRHLWAWLVATALTGSMALLTYLITLQQRPRPQRSGSDTNT